MNTDKPQTKCYISLVNVLLKEKYEVLFKFFQMPSSSRISPCNTDTLYIWTVTINHSYVLMYSIVKLQCNMFRLKVKSRYQAKVETKKKNYYVHYIKAVFVQCGKLTNACVFKAVMAD